MTSTEKESVAEAARELRKGLQPLYTTRLVMLLIGNAVNWLFAIYGSDGWPDYIQCVSADTDH